MNNFYKHTHNQEDYEYELPGIPIQNSDEPLGVTLSKEAAPHLKMIKPYDNAQSSSLKPFKPWLIACVLMLAVGLIFEFGLLGKNGKQGYLCQYLSSNRVCYYLAGPRVK